MNNEQKIAIIAPAILIGAIYPIFHLLSGTFGEKIGWYLGLVIHWFVWGEAFSLLIIGKERAKTIFPATETEPQSVLLVLFPLLMAAPYKLIPAAEYEKPSVDIRSFIIHKFWHWAL